MSTVRLQCLTIEKLLCGQSRCLPVTVQLLGTDDDYVAPTDNVDLATGSNFYYIEVDLVRNPGIYNI